MILFAPGPPTPPLHRRHPAVRELDRLIRCARPGNAPRAILARKVEDSLQLLRRALVGRPLRPYVKTGARARQRRLEL